MKKSCLLAALLVAACSPAAPPPAPIPEPPLLLARTRLGDFTLADLERYLAAKGETVPTDAAARRDKLEELLAGRAAQAEAAALRLLETPEWRERLAERREELLIAELRGRLEREAAAAMVDPATMEAARAASAAKLRQPERRRFRHIFKRLGKNAGPDERRAAEDTLNELRRQVVAGGDFRALAKQHSDSQTAAFEGLIAPMARADLDPALADRLWKLEPGAISEVIATPVGLHLFTLDERLPATEPTAEQIESAARSRAENETRTLALKARYDALLASSGAELRPELFDLPGQPPADDAVVFRLDGAALTAGEVLERWRRLPFHARRTRSLRQVLEDAAARRLLLREAARLRLAEEPALAARLEHLRERALFEAASQRRLALYAAERSAEELDAAYRRDEVSYQRPERRRLRMVLLPLGAGSPHAVFDAADALARRVRAGDEDLADAARRLSRDPSGREGGDLGWVNAQELTVWAGPRIAPAIFGLAEGEVGAPQLIEVYDPARFRDEPVAYAVFRVEQIAPADKAAFAEVVEQVRAKVMAERAAELARRLRADWLATIAPDFLGASRG